MCQVRWKFTVKKTIALVYSGYDVHGLAIPVTHFDGCNVA